jgi:alkylation response protein AidB-like acyl-CoA dehydrogenase
MCLWQRTLHARGWGGVGWPQEFGGPGWTPAEQYIFEEGMRPRAGAPRLISFGLKMIAPVLMAFGSPAQQQRFLPKIMSAEEWWCQGYSEPGSGSDLASVKTRAVREGRPLPRQWPEEPGPRSAITPTGSSAWCAPIRPPKSRAAFPSC